MPRETNIQIRRGTANDWASVNPTLASGEMAIENDTRRVKVGDGTTSWNELRYLGLDGGDIGNEGAEPSQTATPVAPTPTPTLTPEGWDISTAVFSQSFSVAAQETVPQGIFFKPDGLKMYIIGSTGDDVNEYNLSVAWDVSTASYVQNYSVSTREKVPTGVFFKPDGLKMYITGADGANVEDGYSQVYEYSLSIAWDISTATYVAQRYTTNEFARGVVFSPDGVNMYVVESSSSGRAVHRHTVTTPWDITSIALNNGNLSAAQSLDVSAQDTSPQCVQFKPDGSRMYLLGLNGRDITEYALASAWDLSTATVTQTFSVSDQETGVSGLFFKPDGLKMYVIGSVGDDVNEYNLFS